MPTLRDLLTPIVKEVLEGQVDIPTQDGTSNTASAEDKDKAKKATSNRDSVKFVKPGELEEKSEDPDVVREKVNELIAKITECTQDLGIIEDYANDENNTKLKKVIVKISDHINMAMECISELKEVYKTIMEEEHEKAESFGDKVIKAMSKHIKDDETGQKAKKKYMKYIEAAFRKGKNHKEVADRIVSHRFEF